MTDLLGFAVEWLQADGYSKPLLHWLFALLCVLEKPLEPETCASLRYALLESGMFHETYKAIYVAMLY